MEASYKRYRIFSVCGGICIVFGIASTLGILGMLRLRPVRPLVVCAIVLSIMLVVVGVYLTVYSKRMMNRVAAGSVHVAVVQHEQVVSEQGTTMVRSSSVVSSLEADLPPSYESVVDGIPKEQHCCECGMQKHWDYMNV